MGYSSSKVLATVGKGTLQIGDLANSDDLDRLNREAAALNKQLYQGSVSSSVDATLDHRFFSEGGREEIATDYKEMPQNMKTIADTLPDKNSDNPIEAGVGYIWNALGKYSVILPAHDNGGGILAQVPGLTGLMSPQYQYILAKQNSSLFNPEEFIKLDELSYFKGIPENLQKELKDYYISKNSVVITEENATFQRQTNGMNNTLGQAIANAYTQTGKPTEFTLNYNPTYGILADLLECGVDKLGGTTGMAKQTGLFNEEVKTARGKDGSNTALHSQGNLLAKSGAKYIAELQKTGVMPSSGDAESTTGQRPHTASAYGSPVNAIDLQRALKKAGMTLAATITNEDDFVGEGLGGNKGLDGQAPFIDRINLVNFFKLMTSSSPHSNYECKPPAVCGDQP